MLLSSNSCPVDSYEKKNHIWLCKKKNKLQSLNCGGCCCYVLCQSVVDTQWRSARVVPLTYQSRQSAASLVIGDCVSFWGDTGGFGVNKWTSWMVRYTRLEVTALLCYTILLHLLSQPCLYVKEKLLHMCVRVDATNVRLFFDMTVTVVVSPQNVAAAPEQVRQVLIWTIFLSC